MSLIDARHHVWDLAVRDQDWITGPDMALIRIQPWAAAIQAFAAQPNTACKLSGLVTEAALGSPPGTFQPGRCNTERVRGDHVMFGSDWPVCLLACDYADVIGLARTLTGALSATERTAVFSSAAPRVYKLGKSAHRADDH